MCLCWLHRLPVSQPVFSRQPRWSGSVCTALLQPISVTSATATFDPEIYWFTLLNCSREETDQPPGTVCRVYYSHQSCHRMLSYVHWRCTFSRAPGTVETFFCDSGAEYKYNDWLTYLLRHSAQRRLKPYIQRNAANAITSCQAWGYYSTCSASPIGQYQIIFLKTETCVWTTCSGMPQNEKYMGIERTTSLQHPNQRTSMPHHAMPIMHYS